MSSLSLESLKKEIRISLKNPFPSPREDLVMDPTDGVADMRSRYDAAEFSSFHGSLLVRALYRALFKRSPTPLEESRHAARLQKGLPPRLLLLYLSLQPAAWRNRVRILWTTALFHRRKKH